MMKADLVLQGGGMKGLGLIGAVEKLMRAGYSFQRVAGSSAGSITAALLAAGIGVDKLTDTMNHLDYARVPDRGPPGLPVISEGMSLLRNAGAYQGDYLRNFIYEELQQLGVTTFGDLRLVDTDGDRNLPPSQQYSLIVTATDITGGRLLRLPWDYPLLNLDPDEQVVADAVRASASIPLFFKPVIIRDGKSGEESTLVDGGVLSNFPIEIFDRTDGVTPRWPTFGVKILPELPMGSSQLLPKIALPALRLSQLMPPFRLLEQVVTTAIVGNDQTHLDQPCVLRTTMQVDTSEIGIVEFDASKEQRDKVVANGHAAAERFLGEWDWERYKEDCWSS
jgi:predicted acylesterase/phospholipase RssA